MWSHQFKERKQTYLFSTLIITRIHYFFKTVLVELSDKAREAVVLVQLG